MNTATIDPAQAPLWPEATAEMQAQPAIAPQCLTADALRQYFARGVAQDAALLTRYDRCRSQSDSAVRQSQSAAVLIGVQPLPSSCLRVLLTTRSAHLSRHAGEIALPGGRRDPHDTDAAATALREAQEEVGLPPTAAEVLGCLPVVHSVSRYEITPVVALLDADWIPMPDMGEVVDAFWIPLPFLMQPQNYRCHRLCTHHWCAVQWQRRHIWGVTAHILRGLYLVLRNGLDRDNHCLW